MCKQLNQQVTSKEQPTMKYNYLCLLILVILFQSCGTSKELKEALALHDSHNYFSGLLVYNPISKKTIIDYNSRHYFTPASTVKLFTLYTAIQVLPDSIATISYYDKEDRRYFKALADPSFLYDSLPNTTYNFLKNTTKDLILIPENFSDFIYGDGWQWDDYQYYYMPEKSLFPIYGNNTTLIGNTIYPKHFQSQLLEPNPLGYYRDFLQNTFYKDTLERISKREIPFKTSLELSQQLLRDTLQKPVYITNEIEGAKFTPFVSTPTYPLYKRLMNESENFIAEQLFLIISKDKTDKYLVKNTIQYSLDSLLTDIPDKPRWVDASGLSRYNLFTPKSMVYLLDKMYREYGEKKLMDLLPHNGKGGSLQKWYPFNSTYLYAKTGSLSNNHNICGLIKTKKGTLLIFSFMNNNYMIKSSELRKSMNQIIQQLYTNY